jgi:hypothetical protein
MEKKKQMSNLFGLINLKTEKKEDIPKDEKGLKKYINDKIKESNFSTNLTDAFNQDNLYYKNVDNNDQRLTEKYLKGKNPNPLYDLKKSKQQKYTKNPGFASVNMIMSNDSQFKNNSQIKPVRSYINPNKNNMILEKDDEPKDSQFKFS